MVRRFYSRKRRSACRAFDAASAWPSSQRVAGVEGDLRWERPPHCPTFGGISGLGCANAWDACRPWCATAGCLERQWRSLLSSIGLGFRRRCAGIRWRAAKFWLVDTSAHRFHRSAIRRQVALLSGLNLAISSHSAACFKNSSGGCIGVITLPGAPTPAGSHHT